MANASSTLLTADEQLALYAPPVFNDAERQEYFSFNKTEVKLLKSFKRLDYAVYFAISLAFFKIKYTLVNFCYRDVTLERQHIMQRYFPGQATPRSHPSNKDVTSRIENKVLSVTGFSRYHGKSAKKISSAIQKQASFYPRQRQLCKALINLMITEKVSIPPITTVQNSITTIWNKELLRITRNYYRYTRKKQRENILTLLDKTDDKHRIISIRKDMRQFKTNDIKEELIKHQQLKDAFITAKDILPKLQLPDATIEYYAQLTTHYNGTRLNQLSRDTVQLYLLCYSYSRFQILNDNLLEAFKKRTQDYIVKAKNNAKSDIANSVDELNSVRQNLHDLLMTIKNDDNATSIHKSKLFKCIPESKLASTAQMLLNSKLDKELLFWQSIDKQASSIQLNLRPIFLALDITIVRNEPLKKVVTFMKKYFNSKTAMSIPIDIVEKIAKNDTSYFLTEDYVNTNRVEFLLYKTLAHHIDTNKLTLRYSIKHKEIEDNLIKLPKWKKDKHKLLKKTPYTSLKTSPIILLEEKERDLRNLYEKVNSDIQAGQNPDVLIKKNQSGDPIWRLRPLNKASDPNESLFAHFPKRSIIDVFKFVDNKTNFLTSLEPILPRATKTHANKALVSAVVIANALRMGISTMADTSNLNLSTLLTTEKTYIRLDMLTKMTHVINTEAEKLPIFKEYNLRGKYHASLDGMKVGARFNNIAARHSPKFLGLDPGISVYNIILNHFSLASRLISSNEYEGNFTFEMLHHQNTQSFKLDHASTDKHGMNSLNFGLFDLTDNDYAPRIPKPHNETLWGFGRHDEYDGLIIRPDKIISPHYILDNWDDMQRMIVSMLTGEAVPSVVIGKMASAKYNSKTKLAFNHYNNIIRSTFILRYLNDKTFRRAIECALNRGEAYNRLYRAITLLNGGKFRGQSETEMMIWDQCSRLIAAIILYYNTYILNHLYLNASTEEEKCFLLGLSPGAWVHIKLLGHYIFSDADHSELIEQWLAKWNWQAEFQNNGMDSLTL